MALFQGEELVDVTTPDGRVLKLPRSIVPASLLPQAPPVQQIGPAPVGFADETAYNVNPEIPSTTAGVAFDPSGAPLPPERPTPAPAAPPPELKPVTLDTQGLEKQRVTQQRAQAAYAASPRGQMDAARSGVLGAAQQEMDAAEAVGVAEAAQQTAIGGIQAERNKRLNEIVADQQKAQVDQIAQEQKKESEVASFRDRIANTKINRKADHPILLAISAALAGIGSGMKGEKVDTMDIIFRVIDRKVAAQMEDLELLKQTYGFKREELEDLRTRGTRRLEMYNTMMAAEGLRAQREIEATMSRTNNPIIKARAQAAAAKVATFVAEKNQEAVKWGLDYDQKERQHKAQIGLGYSQLNEQREKRKQDAELTREGYMVDLLKQRGANESAMSSEQLKLLAKQQEAVSTRGLKDLKTNTMLYTKQGLAKRAHAAKLEQRAAALDPWAADTPQKKAELQQQAAQLRQDADTYDVALARDVDSAKKAMSGYGATMSALGTIGRINQLAKDNPRVWTEKGPGQAAIDTLYNQLAAEIKDAMQLGAWDKGTANLIVEIIGKPPTGEWDTTWVHNALRRQYNQQDANSLRKLDEFAQRLKARTTADIVASSQNLDRDINPDEFFAPPPKDVADTFEAKLSEAFKQPTAVERAAEVENRGAASQAIHTAGRLLESGAKGLTGTFEPAGSNIDEARRVAETPESLKYTGLTKEQEKWFDAARLRALGPRESGDARRAEEALMKEVLTVADTRPVLASAMARAISDSMPHLYTELRPQIPKGSQLDTMLSQAEQTKAGAALEDLQTMAQRAVVDQASYDALATKASEGNKDAQTLLDAVIQIRAKSRGR